MIYFSEQSDFLYLKKVNLFITIAIKTPKRVSATLCITYVKVLLVLSPVLESITIITTQPIETAGFLFITLHAYTTMSIQI